MVFPLLISVALSAAIPAQLSSRQGCNQLEQKQFSVYKKGKYQTDLTLLPLFPAPPLFFSTHE